MTMTRRGQGNWGETEACAFLVRQGFTIVERNFFTPVGEIDVVATKADDVYFIEVKTREAGPLAFDLAITPDKKRKMKKAISVYCYKRDIRDVGIVTATLMVVVNKRAKTLQFRLAVLV